MALNEAQKSLQLQGGRAYVEIRQRLKTDCGRPCQIVENVKNKVWNEVWNGRYTLVHPSLLSKWAILMIEQGGTDLRRSIHSYHHCTALDLFLAVY